MRRIFVTEGTLLIKNLFYVTENSTHYDLFLPEGVVKLIKPLKFEPCSSRAYDYISVYSHANVTQKNNLFISSKIKNKVNFYSFNSFVDLQLNHKIAKALLKFLNYKEK